MTNNNKQHKVSSFQYTNTFKYVVTLTYSVGSGKVGSRSSNLGQNKEEINFVTGSGFRYGFI